MLSFFKSRAQSKGVKVRATIPETITAPAKVTANSKKICPMASWIKAMGIYTAAKVRVMATTAKPISLDPSFAAFRGDFPSSIWRWMFSRTTMASSTTSPTAKTMARRVMVLIERPKVAMRDSTPTRDKGIATRGMRVALKFLKNKKTMRITRKIASKIECCTDEIEPRINFVLSKLILIVTSSGITLWN